MAEENQRQPRESTLVEVLNKDGNRVVCAIQVTNRTPHDLTDPVVRIHRGRITVPPSTIPPGQLGVLGFRKTNFAPTGTYGTVSWLVRTLNRRVYIMWSAPFNFHFYYNVLGVGVSAVGNVHHPNGEDMFYKMYKGHSDVTIKCDRREYDENNMETVTCRDGGLKVEGTMANTHKSTCIVTISAEREAD